MPPKTDMLARLTRVQQISQQAADEMSLAEFQQLPIEEQGQQLVKFGKAHTGKTYEQLWENEPQYVKWFVSKYQTSTKGEHQLLIHYINRRIEDLEQQEEVQVPTHCTTPAKPKAKAGASSAQMPVTRRDLEDFQADQSWEPIGEVIEEPETIYADMAALQNRMLSLESALQEVVAHLRSS